MSKFKSIVVFCGSSSGNEEIYTLQAKRLGEKLASEKIQLIYGGAKVGIMGTVANAVLENNGEVIGVIPHFLKTKEVAHDQLTRMISVDTMHERKMMMHEMSDAVITLPGGFGTMEEIFEMLTWAQLGLHRKPIGILNTNGFYDHLLAQIQRMVNADFLLKLNQDMILVSYSVDELIEKMEDYIAPEVKKWIGTNEV